MTSPNSSNSEPITFFGFTRAEWLHAYSDDPAGAANMGRLFDDLAASSARGALASVSIESLIRLARSSPDFARRVRGQIEATDPAWREKLEQALSSPPASSPPNFDAKARERWTTLRDLLDSAGRV